MQPQITYSGRFFNLDATTDGVKILSFKLKYGWTTVDCTIGKNINVTTFDSGESGGIHKMSNVEHVGGEFPSDDLMFELRSTHGEHEGALNQLATILTNLKSQFRPRKVHDQGNFTFVHIVLEWNWRDQAEFLGSVAAALSSHAPQIKEQWRPWAAELSADFSLFSRGNDTPSDDSYISKLQRVEAMANNNDCLQTIHAIVLRIHDKNARARARASQKP